MKIFTMAFLACISLAASASPSIEAHDAHIRLAPPGSPAVAGYGVLRNAGTKPVRLVDASSPAATVVELHTHLNENGVMRMRQVAEIMIPARGEAVLKPGSLHLMLIGLNEDMIEGLQVPIDLVFSDGTRKKVIFPVVRKNPKF